MWNVNPNIQCSVEQMWGQQKCYRTMDRQIDRQMDYGQSYSYVTLYSAGTTKVRQEAQRATYRAPEYNVPPFWWICQGGHFCLLISPKNTNLVEDIEILLPVKFLWIPFSGFRGEVENVSANQRPGRPSCFSDRPEKHKRGRGRWDLASCQVRWIPFSSFRGEVENVSANQRPGRPSCFSDRPKKHKLGRERWDLASCQVSLNSVQWFQRRSRKCLSQSEAMTAIFFYRSARKTQTW